MTTDQALEAIATQGLILNNLWQTDRLMFTASLRSATHGHSFAHGTSAAAALEGALAAALAGEGEPLIAQRSGGGADATDKQAEELDL